MYGRTESNHWPRDGREIMIIITFWATSATRSPSTKLGVETPCTRDLGDIGQRRLAPKQCVVR